MRKFLLFVPIVGLLTGCAMRGIVRDPNTGRNVSSSTDRKTDQQSEYPDAFYYNGQLVHVTCHVEPKTGDAVCYLKYVE